MQGHGPISVSLVSLPQQGSILFTLHSFISLYSAATASSTIVSIREEPGRTVNHVGSGKMQESYKQGQLYQTNSLHSCLVFEIVPQSFDLFLQNTRKKSVYIYKELCCDIESTHSVHILYSLRAIKDWVQKFRCCTGAKFRSTFHIMDMQLELLIAHVSSSIFYVYSDVAFSPVHIISQLHRVSPSTFQQYGVH